MTELLTATLRRSRPLTPHVVRLTFEVPGFATTGHPDEWVHVFLGEPGDHRDRRNYTVRAWRPSEQEVDVDVVLHPHGLMVDWVRRAQPGDALPWGDVAGSCAVPPDTDWALLAGDITALPAIGRIVEGLPAGLPTTVVAELADPADRQTWATDADVTVRWVPAGAASGLEHLVRGFPEPAGTGYTWVAGETRAVRAIRRWLRHERGVPKERWSLTGYWLDRMEEWEARYREVEGRMTEIWERGEAEGRDLEDIIDEYDDALERAGL
jgi:NADPH-dependent ferric siderophore reductase